MNNNELEQFSGWRFCHVKNGDKRPYPENWQNRPLQLKYVISNNVGLLLGPVSQGVCALDFDGPSAWTWFDQTFPQTALPPTPTWTSGKPGRCQMAFRVPSTYWFYLKTLKVTHTKNPLIAEGEGFEFRWAGAQSVMPPSTLDDGRTYTWLTAPSTQDIAELPDEILAHWLDHANPDIPPVPPRDLSKITDADLIEVDMLLDQLKQKYPTLDYETWRNTAWAVAHHIGVADAQGMMQHYWPEKKRGEYKMLYRGYNPAMSPTLGSVRFLVGPTPTTTYVNVLNKMKEKYGNN